MSDWKTIFLANLLRSTLSENKKGIQKLGSDPTGLGRLLETNHGGCGVQSGGLPVEDGLFIGLLDRLLLTGLLALHQLAFVQLCVHAQRLQFVPGKPHQYFN
jgi:hypothetical protein